MQRLALLFAAVACIIAGAAFLFVGSLVSDYVERNTERKVSIALKSAGQEWASIRSDGLLLHVSGLAPDESSRFQVISLIGESIDDGRIRDATGVFNKNDIPPPQFSVEMLRNGDGISLIGLIPAATGRERILFRIQGIGDGTEVTDMLESADHTVPDGWDSALEFALTSLESLPRSKISISPNQVTITAITNSLMEKENTEIGLARSKPDNVALVMDISAPRPVITPFSLRLTMDERGTRFDSCSADTEASKSRILIAARSAGLPANEGCTIGLGVPTPRWAQAVEAAIMALQEFGGGNLTFSDADITLIAPDSIDQDTFDDVILALKNKLPDVFSLHAVLPPKPLIDGAGGDVALPEFTATKSPEGLVQLRGRVQNDRSKIAIVTYATSLFGSENVHDMTRVDTSLPDGWPTRVLAGLEALGKLHNGSLLVQPSVLEIRGAGADPDVSSQVTRVLSVKLGDASNYQIDVHYEETIRRKAVLAEGEECVAEITEILLEHQIAFAPSSTKVDEASEDVVDDIAKVMQDCTHVTMEIGGHTDSQGGEKLNLTLSQARAEAVLDGLLAREILTSNLSAKGYGETTPVADNETEEGRLANRRIEFKLIETENESN